MSWTPIHRHLLIKAFVNIPITKVSEGKKLLTDLVDLVGMVPVTKPQAHYVTDEGNKGLTGSINLATSHIAFHVWDETKLLMLDLYSCKDFDDKTVIDFVKERFHGTNQLIGFSFDRDTFSTLNTFMEI